MKGVCEWSVIPMRAEPSDKSEMVNQVLMGETYTILEVIEKWVRIRLEHDDYEGWIDRKQSSSVNLDHRPHPTTIQQPVIINNQFYPAGAWAEIPVLQTSFVTVEDCARSFLKTPYLWGGRTHAGIDCSGFTQMVYRLMGMKIPRDASQQILIEGAITLNFVSEAKPGDLAFFDNTEGKIIHVGIILQVNEQFADIIHASSEVRVDQLDQEGILRDGQYSHRLRAIQHHPHLHQLWVERNAMM